MSADQSSRRAFLSRAVASGTGVTLVAAPLLALAADDGEVTPTEDLMREHGLLDRVLLIYEELSRRLTAGAEAPAQILGESASIVSKFVEAYHEKIEEEEVFPRLEKVGKLVDLTKILRAQHVAGRAITAQIAAAARAGSLSDKARATAVQGSIAAFIRMYRPHAAREDTILFPAFHGSMKEKEFRELGERFEEREHKLLGKEGFEGVLDHVGQLERALGIYDLDHFTPAASGH
jgi:hemerythrin-like domain-containing protein